jgi:hypothetical protein
MSKAKRLNGKRVARPEKIGLLYLFLIPLFLSVVKSLFSSDYSGFMLKGVGFLLLSGAISLASKGWHQKTLYEKATLARAPKIPFLKLAAFGLGVSAFYLSFFVGGKTLLPALFVGVLAPIGFYLYYGFDPKQDKLGNIDGISAQLVIDTIKEANQKLSDIRNDMESIADKPLHEKLTIATQKADTILATIQEDPKDIRVARKFLIVYIDGIAKVTNSYTQMKEDEITTDTKEKLYSLMDDVENRFSSELTRLKENNQFDLDVHIDVLKEQIKN